MSTVFGHATVGHNHSG